MSEGEISINRSEKFSVTGTSYNTKSGAALITDTQEVYYLDGMTSWPDADLEKRFTVSGRLKVIEHKEEDLTNEKGEYVQGMVGKQKIIVKPKWKKAP